MNTKTDLFVIGIGFRPLCAAASEAVCLSAQVLTSPRLDEIFQKYREYKIVRERIVVIDGIEETFSAIRLHRASGDSHPLAVLAAGDPLYHGIGSRITHEFGTKGIEIMPDLSSMQVAFSKILMPWHDVFSVSLHGGPDPGRRRNLPNPPESLPDLLSHHEKICVLTDRVNDPVRIAGIFIKQKKGRKPAMIVCERLGYPDERIISGAPDEMVSASYREPNIVILLKDGISHG